MSIKITNQILLLLGCNRISISWHSFSMSTVFKLFAIKLFNVYLFVAQHIIEATRSIPEDVHSNIVANLLIHVRI